MDALTQQITDLLDEQETRYRTLKRILARQVACLQRADLAGVGTTNAEIREAMGQLAGIETRLTPLVRQWQERPEAAGGPISEKAQAMCAMVTDLQDLRMQSEGLTKAMMDRTRQEMMSLSAGAQAARGYAPRPPEEARFVDRTR